MHLLAWAAHERRPQDKVDMARSKFRVSRRWAEVAHRLPPEEEVA